VARHKLIILSAFPIARVPPCRMKTSAWTMGRRSRITSLRCAGGTCKRAVMSAARHPRNAEFTGFFARLQTLPFTFAHAVSLVNHWLAVFSGKRRAHGRTENSVARVASLPLPRKSQAAACSSRDDDWRPSARPCSQIAPLRDFFTFGNMPISARLRAYMPLCLIDPMLEQRI